MQKITFNKGIELTVNMPSESTPTREQRISYKQLQILAEMNESIHTLTRIEAVLDEINQSIAPINDTHRIADDASIISATVAAPTGTLSDKMNQLLIELQNWDDDF